MAEDDGSWKTFMTTLWTLLDEEDDDAKWTLKEQTALTQVLIACFQSLDVQQVASSVLQLTSLPLWSALSPAQRALEFQTYPKLERHWNRIMSENSTKVEEKETPKKNKRRKLEATVETETPRLEQTAFVRRLDAFFQVVKAPVDDSISKYEITLRLRFVALFLALLIDLLSQLPTRRFLLVVLRRRHVRTVLRGSALVQHASQWQSAHERQALEKQLALLDACMIFPIDAHTGTSLSAREYREHQARHIQALQQCAFQSFRNTRVEELAIAPCSHIADASSFTEMLNGIVTADRSRLSSFAIAVGVLADQAEAEATSDTELVEFFKEEYSVGASSGALSSSAPVFPTELDIWNEMLDRKEAAQTPEQGDDVTGEIYGAKDTILFPVLPLRKLGLQFLNLDDYLQRNYELLRLEAAQDIRADLEVAIKQLDGVRALRTTSDNDTIFRGSLELLCRLRVRFRLSRWASRRSAKLPQLQSLHMSKRSSRAGMIASTLTATRLKRWCFS